NGCHILVAAARRLADADAAIAGEAQRFLIVVASTPLGLYLLFKQNNCFVVALRELLKENETVQFRCFEFISKLSGMSAQYFDEFLKSGFIEKLLNELNSSDVLVKLNVLEVLTTMSIGGVHCLKHFHASGLLKKLYTLLDQSQSDPDATFLFPAVIKFFGHLAKVEPRSFNDEYPGFLKAVFHLVINYRLLEVSQRLLAFDSLGLIASTSDGKCILEKYG
uniref:26S proteasome non-ATPase regulatory subunit 5 n=1 Tax=Romanomermis culicivorax TaxID=13658 RepID=A0A915HMF4_ROMCU